MNTSDYLIGLDIGTTSCKAIAIDEDGRILASGIAYYCMHSPMVGRAEQDPEQIWQGVVDALQQLNRQLPDHHPLALSFSGAMHTLLPVNEDGTPLAPAMTWADNRASSQAGILRKRTDTIALYKRTGCPLQSTYLPARLLWMSEQAPNIFSHASLFTSLKDWVIHRLTGQWITDMGLASTTGLMDIHEKVWDSEALQLSGIDVARLSEIVPPTMVVGSIQGDTARHIGLPTGLRIIAGNSDGGLANLGAGAVEDGEVVITVGTSGAVRCITDQPIYDSGMRTWCYVLDERRWLAGGAINNGGLAIQWIRDNFYQEIEGDLGYQSLMEDASRVPAGSDGVLVLPYFTGERSPHWNPEATSMITGLILSSDRSSIGRAVLEGVAFCLADVWEVLSGNFKIHEPIRLTGTITKSEVWSQILSDVLGVPLISIEAADASAIGAAAIGFSALEPGFDFSRFVTSIDHGMLIQPDMNRHDIYKEVHKRFQQMYDCMYGSNSQKFDDHG